MFPLLSSNCIKLVFSTALLFPLKIVTLLLSHMSPMLFFHTWPRLPVDRHAALHFSKKISSILTVAWEDQRTKEISKLDEPKKLKEEVVIFTATAWQPVQQGRRYCIFSTRLYFVCLKYISCFLKYEYFSKNGPHIVGSLEKSHSCNATEWKSREG